MNDTHIDKVAVELRLARRHVAATAALLAEGATVPFIARYRKEATGSMDEVAIAQVRDRMTALAELDDRRAAIVRSLEERELLTDELKRAIEAAETMTALEDVYAPYRPKRRTRATIAKEAGLEPLADLLFDHQATIDPVVAAGAEKLENRLSPPPSPVNRPAAPGPADPPDGRGEGRGHGSPSLLWGDVEEGS